MARSVFPLRWREEFTHMRRRELMRPPYGLSTHPSSWVTFRTSSFLIFIYVKAVPVMLVVGNVCMELWTCRRVRQTSGGACQDCTAATLHHRIYWTSPCPLCCHSKAGGTIVMHTAQALCALEGQCIEGWNITVGPVEACSTNKIISSKHSRHFSIIQAAGHTAQRY